MSERDMNDLFHKIFGRLLDLADDQAQPDEIDATIRAGATFRGTNLWLLVFAIFIASIGLNVNSAAVIIGAMLVSPLMGPIMAIGYGIGVSDFALIRSSAKNLAVAVVFSLLTSTLYFTLTPLSGAGSELLARTSPAIWDVLIAVFGGLSGMIGVTRRVKSNVIPGVAIATALMPPLCTVGYGIANAQPSYAFGALYLFSINSVYIATATLVMTRVMQLPEVVQVDDRARTRAQNLIGAVVLVTGVPSVYLAFDLVQEELFVRRAERYITASFPADQGTFVAHRELDADERLIRVTLIGEEVDDARRAALEAELTTWELAGARLELRQARQEGLDVDQLRAEVASELQQNTLVVLDEKIKQIAALEKRLAEHESSEQTFTALLAELRASYPAAAALDVGHGRLWMDGEDHDALLVSLDIPLSEEEQARLVAWLKVRSGVEHVRLSTPALSRPR